MLSEFAVVRAGEPDDAEALARVFREAWMSAYTGIIPFTHLSAMVARHGRDYWQRALGGCDNPLVLAVGGQVAGYATYGRSRGNLPYEGEIYELYLAPVYQGLGFGERLFESARARLDQRQLDGLVVWALTDNTNACDFYWRRGGRPIAESAEHFGEVRIGKTAFGWR
jgi:ribosomal protein S18 acetylase RimI-like enzyme